jgi:hypothetical protein
VDLSSEIRDEMPILWHLASLKLFIDPDSHRSMIILQVTTFNC